MAGRRLRASLFAMSSNLKRLRAGLMLGAVALAALPAGAQKAPPPAFALTALPPQPVGVPFPGETWPRGELGAGVNGAALRAQIEGAFAGAFPDLGQTRAVVIVQGGRIVLERYAPDFDATTPQVSWSIAKSVTGALVALAIRDGIVRSLDEPLALEAWPDDDPRRAITFRQALAMADGLDWKEANQDPVNDDAARMLFGEGREDVIRYAAAKRLAHAPGVRWNYSTGTSHLIAQALRERFWARNPTDLSAGTDPFRDFMREELFLKIGMESAAPEFDRAGAFYGGSLVYATPQDWARFGLLYLRGGRWGAEQVIPADLVALARTPSPGAGVEDYGHHWWINADGIGLMGAKGPRDSFEAHGYQGQVIAVIPSKDLVVVRMGIMPDGSWPQLGAWMQGLVAAFPDVPAAQE